MMITWKHIAMHNSTCPIWQEAVWNILLKHFDGNEEVVTHEIGVEMANISTQQERLSGPHLVRSWTEIPHGLRRHA